VTGWLVPSAGQKIPVQPGWYPPPQNIPLAENRFLQAGKEGSTELKIQRKNLGSALPPSIGPKAGKMILSNLAGQFVTLGANIPAFLLISWCQ
jgi:hypothetical protein